MNRFQILKGDNPPVVKKKKVVPKPLYFYGVDYGTRRDNTAVAICHEKQGIVFLDFYGLLEDSSYIALDKWLHKLGSTFPIYKLAVDTGRLYQWEFSSLGYEQVRCTREMHFNVKEGLLQNKLFDRYGTPSRMSLEHITDAIALAYDSVLKAPKVPYDTNFIHGNQLSQ